MVNERFADVPDRKEVFTPRHLIYPESWFQCEDVFGHSQEPVSVYFEGYRKAAGFFSVEFRLKDADKSFDWPIGKLSAIQPKIKGGEASFAIRVERSERKGKRREEGWTLLGVIDRNGERSIIAGMTDGKGTHLKYLSDEEAISLNVNEVY